VFDYVDVGDTAGEYEYTGDYEGGCLGYNEDDAVDNCDDIVDADSDEGVVVVVYYDYDDSGGYQVPLPPSPTLSSSSSPPPPTTTTQYPPS